MKEPRGEGWWGGGGAPDVFSGGWMCGCLFCLFVCDGLMLMLYWACLDEGRKEGRNERTNKGERNVSPELCVGECQVVPDGLEG